MTLQIMGTRLGSKNNGEERKSERFERKKRELSEKLYIEEKEMNGLKYFQFPDL